MTSGTTIAPYGSGDDGLAGLDESNLCNGLLASAPNVSSPAHGQRCRFCAAASRRFRRCRLSSESSPAALPSWLGCEEWSVVRDLESLSSFSFDVALEGAATRTASTTPRARSERGQEELADADVARLVASVDVMEEEDARELEDVEEDGDDGEVEAELL